MRMVSNEQLQSYKRDVWLFRLAGVVLYQSIVILLVLVLFSIVPWGGEQHRSWLAILLCTPFLVLFQLLPTAVLSHAQVTSEPQPAVLNRHLPRNTGKRITALLKPLSHVLGRARDLRHLARALTLAAAFSLSGALFESLYVWTRGGPITRGAPAFGGLLGICYLLFIISRGEDILTFPALHRHRIFRIKHHLLSALVPAAEVSLFALTAYIALAVINLTSWRSLWEAHPIRLLITGLLSCYCFSMGLHIVQVIYTEQLSFGPSGDDSDSTVLFSALQEDKDEALQSSAFAELCSIAESRGKAAIRRKAIFADDSGAAWQLPGQVCLKEIENLTHAVAEALPQSSHKSASTGTSKAVKWNQLLTNTKQTLVTPNWQHDVAAWQIRASYQRTAWAIRTLAGFAAASREEDRFGVLQLTEPSLGTITQTILSLLLVLQQHIKTAASIGARRLRSEQQITGPGKVDQYAQALADIAENSACLLADTFGSDLIPTLLSSPGNAPYGTSTELTEALEACIHHQRGLQI